MTFNQNTIQIAETLRAAGFQALVAGGAVRNFLLGIPAKDIDIATDAMPEQIEALFPKTIPLGKAFGVIVVVMPDGEKFEVATFRSDSENSDGRRPDGVVFEQNAKADASRRDFTVNAMFIDPLTGELFDFFGGKTDIEKKMIRFVGDPEKRIAEDKLRMLRAVRFAANLGFTLEGETFLAVHKNAPLTVVVSQERIRDEFMKILGGNDPVKGIMLMAHSGLLEVILPSVMMLRGVEQPREWHPEGDVFKHTIGVVRHLTGKGALTVLAGLLHDIGKPKKAKFNPEKGRVQFIGHDLASADMAEVIMRRLKFSNAEIEEVIFAVREHMRMHNFNKMGLAKRRLLVGEKHFPTLLDLSIADVRSTGVEPTEMIAEAERLMALPPEPVLLTGDDLIEMGLTPGPIFGKILQTVRLAQLEGKISTVEQARKMAKGIS